MTIIKFKNGEILQVKNEEAKMIAYSIERGYDRYIQKTVDGDIELIIYLADILYLNKI